MAITITGTGTELDPYVCYSWEDFESLAYIVDIDHTSSNNYTLELPETGIVPIPQEQVNIYIKFANYRDPDDPESLGVDVKEVDFDNHCIPHTLLFQNVCQIDFNGWTFKNIGVSYWRDELVDTGGGSWSVVSAECIGNTIIIENCRHNLSPLIYPKDYVKILNGRFLINEDWNALRENDVDEPALKITNNTYSHLITDVSFIKDEIDNYQQNDLGGNLYGRCFPLFFLSTYKYFFRVYFDRCDFITYQSGFTEMYDIYTHRTKDDGYSFIQHSPNYRYTGNTYYLYPNAVSNSPGNALFVYCNIYFYNNQGIPKWSTDTNMYFLNSKIKLFGNATIADMDTLKQYDYTEQEYVLMWNYDNLINLIRYWHGCLYNYCNIDIIVNLPRTIWAEKFNLFTAIYNSSLNINCPNTNNCTFTGSANGGDVYYSGVFIHAYPMSFNADDDTIQNARKIIDITGVRVNNYYELLDNPDYVLSETNIPDDKYRILEMQTGDNINNYSTYLQLKQNFRYSRYIHNGLPFVPMYDFPKVEGWDVNRTVNALYNDESPVKVMFNNVDITSMWTANNIDGLHWQREYEPILQSQLYGNWFNNTEQWDNERKTIETDYVYIGDEQAIQETVVPYMLEEHTYTNPMSHITYTYYKPKKVETFNIAEYQDNDWLPLETYKHSPENLTGVEVDTDVQDLTKCMWFDINKTMLNQFNWCIVISAMTTDYNSNIDNYLFYLPLTDINGVTHIYYIKQNSYYDTTEERFVLSYSTNITEESVEYEDRPINIPRNPDLYDGCHIFAINCYGILLELFVDGQLFGSINITDYMKSEEPIQYNATIGHGTYTYNENVQDKDYNVNNGFIGTILGVHMFADYCSWADIWNIYSTYGIKFFRKGKDPIFDPILKEITVAYVPNTINILEGDTISYSDFVIYGQYTSGTEEIHSDLTYSIAEGTTASGVGSHTVTITCEDLPGWSYEFTLNVQTSYIIQITQLDENLADTNTVYTCDTMSEARTYLVNASSDNRYKLEISDRYPNTSLNEYSAVNACTTLHSVYLPDKITSISSYCFTNCTNLKEVHFGNSNMSISGDCFKNCGFETLTIPSNVNINGNCFRDNINLTTVIFNNPIIGGFRDCTALTNIVINNNVTYIRSQAFRGCTELVNADLSMVYGTIEEDAFYNCTKLESVRFSDNLKYVASGVFTGTKLLNDFNSSENTYLIINNYLVATKTINDTNITLPNNITGIAYGVLNIGGTMPNCTTLTLPTSLKYLSTRALYPDNAHSTQLQTLNIPSLVAVQNSYWARTNANQNVTVENINMGKDVVAVNADITYGNDFTYNLRATNVTIDSQNTTYKVQDNAIISYDGEILYRYLNSSSMDNIIPNGIKSVVDNALELLNNTTSLYIPSSVINMSYSNVTIECVIVDGSYSTKSSFASMFNKNNGECVYTENVSIRTIDSTTLKPVGTTVTYALSTADVKSTISATPGSSGPFYSLYCGSRIPIANVQLLGSCNSLYKAVIETPLTVLPNSQFYNSKNLVFIHLPETLTNIQANVFGYCSSLTTLNIPLSVENIHYNAFANSGFVKVNGQDVQDAVIVDGWLISWRNIGSTSTDVVFDSSVHTILEQTLYNKSICPNIENITSVNLNNVRNPKWTGTNANFSKSTKITSYSCAVTNTGLASDGGIVYTKNYDTMVMCPPMISGDVVINEGCLTIPSGLFTGNANITSVNINNVRELNNGTSNSSNFGNKFTGITTYTANSNNTMYSSYKGIIYTKNFNVAILVPKLISEIDIHDNCTTLSSSVFSSCPNVTTINLNNVTDANLATNFIPSNYTHATSYSVSQYNPAYASDNDVLYSKDFTVLLRYPKAKIGDFTPHAFCTTLSDNAMNSANSAGYTINLNNVSNFGTRSLNNCRATIILNKPITSLGESAFYYCTNLTSSVELTSDITIIPKQAFYQTSISSIILHEGLLTIQDYAFQYCSQLISVVLPNTVTTIGSAAFSNCTSLSTVTIPPSVTSIGITAFATTPFLTDLRQQDPLVIINNIIVDTATCTGSVVIPEGVTTIPSSGFNSNKNITDVTLSSTVTSVGQLAFYNCTNLVSFTATNNLVSLDSQAFNTCTSLITVNLGTITAIKERTFYGCSSLLSISIPSTVTSIGDYVFYNCTSLTTVTMTSSELTMGSNVFNGCKNLTSITLAPGLTSMKSYAFNNCSSLTSINVPGSLKTLPQSTFNGCINLTSITLNEGLETIESYAFSYNNSSTGKCGVTTITIPKSVTTFKGSTTGDVYTFDNRYFVNLQTIYIKNPQGTYDTSKWKNVTASIQYI